jgi:ribosomal protein S18 acetylase RimI-like enzyme
VEIDIDNDIIWRPLTVADAPAAAELCAAAEAVDDEGETYGAADIAEELNAPRVEPGRGAFGAFTPGGRLVAFAFVFARTAADPVHQMHLWSVVAPQWRGFGIGTELTERALDAARDISSLRFPGAPAVLQRSVYEPLTDLAAHLEKRGFTVQHYEIGMERMIGPDEAATAPTPPEGFELVGYTPELAEEVRLTHNEAFVPDHPGSTPMTAETFAAQTGSASFRADLSFILRHAADGRLAGYVLSLCYPAATEATGRSDVYLDYIGTRREYRGRGVAGTVIAAAVHAAAGQGFGSASLAVRADNPSGALSVYEKAGFSTRRTFVSYVKTVD